MAISYPPVLINEYLSEKVKDRIGDTYANKLLFFPTIPTDIEALNASNPAAATDTFAVYGRMPQVRRGSFPHIKKEQTIYYFYRMGSTLDQLVETSQILFDLMDREDESAQEINEWISKKVGTNGLVKIGDGRMAKDFKPVYFHRIQSYQLEETQNVIFPKTTRTYSALKIIVDYHYHVSDYN